MIESGIRFWYERKRGLTAVWGREAVQFLNGLITNDIAAPGDGDGMRAAFPNAQGRTLALVRVLRTGDRFLIETEEATREKVFQNLFRFTFAGDFFVEDLSEQYSFFTVSGFDPEIEGAVRFDSPVGTDLFVPADEAGRFREAAAAASVGELTPEGYETLRIEAGIPLFGADFDETTIAPEIGTEGLISYTKGCYIGQEIIARIHFRGHVAKQLRGLVFDGEPGDGNRDLTAADGKSAGRVTSVVFSPRFGRWIGLGFVRWEHLADGTQLRLGETAAVVRNLPFEAETARNPVL